MIATQENGQHTTTIKCLALEEVDDSKIMFLNSA